MVERLNLRLVFVSVVSLEKLVLADLVLSTPPAWRVSN